MGIQLLLYLKQEQSWKFMDSNTYTISLELVFSCLAMIIGVGSFLASRSKESDRNGRERATVEVKLDYIAQSLDDLKAQINESREEDERNKNKISEMEKIMLKHSMRLNTIENELNIDHKEFKEDE